jgi:hypothetical protein
MVGAIKGSTKKEPLVVGKPSTFMMDYLASEWVPVFSPVWLSYLKTLVIILIPTLETHSTACPGAPDTVLLVMYQYRDRFHCSNEMNYGVTGSISKHHRSVWWETVWTLTFFLAKMGVAQLSWFYQVNYAARNSRASDSSGFVTNKLVWMLECSDVVWTWFLPF